MARTRVGDILGSMREGLSDAGERGQDLARDVAERVEDVLDEAGVQGKRIRKELAHRWKTVDRVGRENAFVMAIAALGVGIVVGYLLSRDDD
jgi:ElaB/YqjD/DUF883 family membrane-anchored ribosome-binding protein